ncbi:phytoene/squalene synthase family protein [Streptomyces cacaoi]|uniref:phytoene/squalene synthase family protein n=1 Tax=Streptomyces cacaoi TaxID=1898 RepID=UPI0011F15555|nr:phytoene/squalene synthase family protein [Streptomyces cacaoi]
MTGRELDAAGITDPALRDAYRRCRALNARHGRTYFLATRLLPPDRRPAVHALYGFARYADDIVDSMGAVGPSDTVAPLGTVGATTPEPTAEGAGTARSTRAGRSAGHAGHAGNVPGAPLGDGAPDGARGAALARLADQLDRALPGGPEAEPTASRAPEATGRVEAADPVGADPAVAAEPGVAAGPVAAGSAPTEPVVTAVAHTAARYAIPRRHFTDFLDSMRSDLTVTDYATYADLLGYMHGSAAVIGLQMLPVLGTTVPREEAEAPAAALGVAFQLTNFLRDVGEDLDRGRVYLPQDLLHAHGVDRALLSWSRTTGRTDARITAALRAAEHLVRGVYREAAPGLAMLDPVSRPCIRAAFVLYRGILDAVAADGYPVLHRRCAVPRHRRAVVALDGLVRCTAARYRSGTPAWPAPRTTPARRPAGPEEAR